MSFLAVLAFAPFAEANSRYLPDDLRLFGEIKSSHTSFRDAEDAHRDNIEYITENFDYKLLYEEFESANIFRLTVYGACIISFSKIFQHFHDSGIYKYVIIDRYDLSDTSYSPTPTEDSSVFPQLNLSSYPTGINLYALAPHMTTDTEQDVAIAVLDRWMSTYNRDLEAVELGPEPGGQPGRLRHPSEHTGLPPEANPAHGQHVVSTVAAEWDNGIGMSGAGLNTRVISYNVSNPLATGMAQSSQVAALQHIRDTSQTRTVINMSFSSPSPMGGNVSTSPRQNLITYMIEQGHVFVATAGNNGNTPEGNEPRWPGQYEGVIVVGGHTNAGIAHANSNHYNTFILAPWGARVITIYGRVSTSTFGGTSFAAPKVAAAIALYLRQHPDATHAEIVEGLRRTAIPVAGQTPGRDRRNGYGILDVNRFVRGYLSPDPERGRASLPPENNVLTFSVRNPAGGALADAIVELYQPSNRANTLMTLRTNSQGQVTTTELAPGNWNWEQVTSSGDGLLTASPGARGTITVRDNGSFSTGGILHFEDTVNIIARTIHTVTFINSYNGTETVIYDLVWGDLIAPPADPQRPSHNFEGWFSSPIGGVQWIFASAVVTENLRLYAQFEANALNSVTGNVPLTQVVQMAYGTPELSTAFSFTVTALSFNGGSHADDIARLHSTGMPSVRIIHFDLNSPSSATGGVITVTGLTNVLEGVNFTFPGIYIWEIAGAGGSSAHEPPNRMMNYSPAVYHLIVDIRQSDTGYLSFASDIIPQIVDNESQTTGQNTDYPLFTNVYRRTTAGTVQHRQALSVSKFIEGGDAFTVFPLEIVLTSPYIWQENFPARAYVYTENVRGTGIDLVLEPGIAFTHEASLAHNQRIVLERLPVGTTWNVSYVPGNFSPQAQVMASGASPISYGYQNVSNGQLSTGTYVIGIAENSIAVLSKRESTVLPTGLIVTFSSLALTLMLAAVAFPKIFLSQGLPTQQRFGIMEVANMLGGLGRRYYR